jgi:D-alanyl-D-alanine dipeptidase
MPSSIPAPLAESRQLVVVTTSAWGATQGVLRRFERSNQHDAWHETGAATAIVTGRTGLAWGVGFDALDADGSAPHKHEGDGKSPAGAFALDTVFGFAPRDSMSWVHLPYVPLTSAVDCVDDTSSSHYNTVVSKAGVSAVDWSSAEHMREIGVYRYGVIVGYNAARPVRGRGSCIFLHIWSGATSTTAGCTAFDVVALRELIAWLDPRRRPLLVQLPAAEYARLQAAWSLPSL